MSLDIKYIGPLKGGQFYPVAQNKTAIVLHHTAGGSIKEAVNWWNQTPDVVGTALAVERNGQAYQCFEINQWAWSLGLKIADDLKTRFEKGNVGIELASYGWVLPEGDKFYAYPLWPNKTRRVLIAKDDVIELKVAYKGYKFYHKYTDAQIKTTIELCRYLVDRFKIEVQKDLTKIWDYDIEVAIKNRPGIFTHNTFRKDKCDVYPDPRLIQGLMNEFNPKTNSPTTK